MGGKAIGQGPNWPLGLHASIQPRFLERGTRRNTKRLDRRKENAVFELPPGG